MFVRFVALSIFIVFSCFAQDEVLDAAPNSFGMKKPSPEVLALLNELPAREDNLRLVESNLSFLFSPDRFIRVELEPAAEISEGRLFEIAPKFTADGKVKYTAKVSAHFQNNPALELLLKIYSPNLSLRFVEIMANASAGSPLAKTYLAKKELEAYSHVLKLKRIDLRKSPVPEGTEKMIVIFEKLHAEAEENHRRILKAAKSEMRRRQKAFESRKPEFARLEAEEVKLNDLIARNDRSGVRRLIETYLPWEIMEPSEVSMWKTSLEAMEHPDFSRAQLVFRGLDDDRLLNGSSPEKPANVSSVLSRNQGSYTRRLRSLTTYRPRLNGGGKDTPITLLSLMDSHAADPMGSPFLSSSDLNTASEFGIRKRAALNIDERRLIPNPFSVGSESELLTPLIIFPDEIVHFEEASKLQQLSNSEFITKVESKIGRPLTATEKSGVAANEFRENASRKFSTFLNDVSSTTRSFCVPGSACANCVSSGLQTLHRLSP